MREYKTVKSENNDEFVEKRSRFIGYCRPAATEQEALDYINKIRSKHWDATHNVYAYIIRETGVKRCSDDGEPQKTAGVPVLDVLEKNGLTDVVVVVTRYFGGIMLGAGGLVRAYSHGSRIAVEAAGIIAMRECLLCNVSCSYSQYGKIAALVPECAGVIDDTKFTDVVSISFHISEEERKRLDKEIAEATGGTVKTEKSGSKFFVFEDF